MTIVHPNTQAAYNSLLNWLRDDRLEARIPWHWMEDRLRRARGWSMWEDPKSFLEDVREGYRRNPWGEQGHYTEVWLEKDALSGVFTNALSRYRVTLNVGRGYDGWSSIKKAADRYIRREDVGVETTVFYFGDFDPSGEDMHRSLQERLAILGAFPELPKVQARLATRLLRLCSVSRGQRVRAVSPGGQVLASAVASPALVDRVAQHAGFCGLHGVGDWELCGAEYGYPARPHARQRRNVGWSDVLPRRGGPYAARMAGFGAVEIVQRASCKMTIGD